MSYYLPWRLPYHEALAVLQVKEDILGGDLFHHAHHPFLVGLFYGIYPQLLLVHIFLCTCCSSECVDINITNGFYVLLTVVC